jgi:uncharacterized protein YbbC (DUF1343 family)/CubicO group peptidase (beta-lactamase class C family)
MNRRLVIRLILAWALIAVGQPGRTLSLAAAGQAPPQSGAGGQGTTAGAARPGPGAAVTFDVARLAEVDALVEAAIKAKQLPGAVVLVGHDDAVVYRKAFGNRAVEPSVEPMTLETMFDMASLTKVIATTTSVMMLVEDGRIRLADRVSAYVPGFGRYGKNDITIRHLLTHTSGLRPDLDLGDGWTGYDTAIARAIEEVPTAAPGERFIYSDINFFLLGDVVRRVSGMGLDRFAATRIFEPLGMRDTMFKPPASLKARIAPTEREGQGLPVLRGVVHDPTARRMGGVAGHAGLFSTAADMSVFCRMLLGDGRVGRARILAPLSVAKMTMPATVPGMASVRGLGWDIDSAYSSNRGDLLPIGSFGHTGFTGTSLWIDPITRTYIVFLSNRVHPDGRGDVTPLRAKLATVVASAIRPSGEASLDLRRARWNGGDFGAAGSTAATRDPGPVASGIDVLQAEAFARLRGRRVGLVTNHTGRSRTGSSTIDLLKEANGVELVALFSPEHGIRGILDEAVPSTRDDKTGLPIYSLYGKTPRPTTEMLTGIDTVVIDLQDIGARFYTYMTTMAYVMEEAAKRKIAVMVLDRPNPINGFQIEGPTIPKDALTFTSYFPMPIRHGMTFGELATLFNAENKIGADLTVVTMTGWRRADWFDETGLAWVSPSPNMRNMNEATLYPGIGAIEGTNISVGRGTDTPFEQMGAPWIDGAQLARELRERRLPGVTFYPVSFTPSSSKYAGEACQGVFMIVTDRAALRPVRLGLEVAAALARLYPRDFKIEAAERLFGSRTALSRVQAGEDAAVVAASWAGDEARWRLLRAKYLLYQ